MKTTVAAALSDQLKQMGTENFFQLTGGDQPLWIALHDAGIKMILARSEASSVYMADGYARASGKPAITYGQAGPGAANVAAALADPFWAQSPVVAITGATATGRMYMGEYQDLEQMSLFNPVTKWNGFTASPERVPELVTFAIMQAIAGNPGPTHLDIPKDFFSREVELSERRFAGFTAISPISPDNGSIHSAAEEILVAQRPVIIAGEGVVLSGAGEALKTFAEALGIPVATTMGGKTGFPGNHPLNIGITGRYSAKVANDLVSESDCVLVIGSRLGGLATRGYTVPNLNTKIIRVDIDSAVLDGNTTYTPSVKILGDACLVLKALVHEMEGKRLCSDAINWAEYAQKKTRIWRDEVKAKTVNTTKEPVLTPFGIINELALHNQDITVVADTGYMAAWTGVLYPTMRAGSYFRATGSLGWALPASLGVQMARQEKVVCVSGDGGIGYHLADIESAVRLKIPVVVVIFNNNGLTFEYHEQKYLHNDRVVPEANNLTDVDYGAVARALGADGVRVRTRAEFDMAFRAGLASSSPTVIDAVVDREAFPPVTNFERVMTRTI